MSACHVRQRAPALLSPPPCVPLAATLAGPAPLPVCGGWLGPACRWRLALLLALLAFPGIAGGARVSSSLSTTHHVHHFHNKHGTVPIAINRMPFLTRGGHDVGTDRFINEVDTGRFGNLAPKWLCRHGSCRAAGAPSHCKAQTLRRPNPSEPGSVET
ncbi:hypothetical protein SKAU_G00269350 [Synaphobranchus kaupii]|uniref:Uncharacterized protein n=1 Tax=Synaphobranchus kaupii TaxID=118154 RepID=A0A9Q1IQF3_SYNKA|nr:hypothetical protein SKAU_G00269350 [Synaphobranchus kaupii]